MEPPPPLWHDELAGKLEDHRRKRSRLRGQFDPNSSLDFEFSDAGDGSLDDSVDAELNRPAHDEDLLDSPLAPSLGDSRSREPFSLEKPAEGMRVLTSAAVEAGESKLGEEDVYAQPVEIILESPAASAARAGLHRTPGGLRVAPLGQRFLAGMVDAAILVAGSGLFALIFWIVGGRVTMNPLNLLVFGSIATLFVLAYFGMFTALSSSTPGLLWMNLELRSVAGGHPSLAESFWRAFGYLVSGASLMLGFAWALADSDHLTWHDHMSGTYVTPIEH
jgi:uncharacterized RDD family membrane protein YckC